MCFMARNSTLESFLVEDSKKGLTKKLGTRIKELGTGVSIRVWILVSIKIT